MYVFRNTSELREEYVRRQDEATRMRDRFQGLIERYENRNTQPPHVKTRIETETRHEGGVEYLRQRRRGEAEAAVTWALAIDMLDGVQPPLYVAAQQ
jgi:hypothetical protein